MLISTSKRFIFVANTKSASTAIEHMLTPYAEYIYKGPPRIKHTALSQAEALAPEVFTDPEYPFDSFFKFGVMRDPLEWITSWYRYRSGNAVSNPLPQGMSFEAFWQRRDWNIQRKDGRKFLQSSMFTDANGTCIADVIIPYWQMDDQAGQIFDALNIPYALTRRNVSVIRKIDEAVPPALLAEIQDYYQDDYALYRQLDEINRAGIETLRRRAETK